MNLRVPGKTFLVGEYAVLVGGTALGLATEPYFESLSTLTSPHPESAAGLFLKGEQSRNLKNPYAVGGFGLSTAEFISAWFEKNNIAKLRPAAYPKMFSDYRDQFSAAKPSGADLMIQLLGGVTHFKPNVSESQKIEWPYNEIGFDIISTGIKVPTHEHLNQLDLKKLEDLPKTSENVIKSFLTSDAQTFLTQLAGWSQILKSKGLQHNHSIDLVTEIQKNENILLVKPNGALGADTATVFYKVENQKSVRESLVSLKLSMAADRDCLAWGAHYVD